MGKKYSIYLIDIAKEFDIYDNIHVSTVALSKIFSLSQQSTSRILTEMQKSELLIKEVNSSGLSFKLTKKGIDELKVINKNLNKHFKDSLTFEGKIVDGLGEGKYYVNLEKYKNEFKSLLKKSPYPGTLNVKIDPKHVDKIKSKFNPIIIDGFSTKERTFGNLVCYKCKVNNFDGLIVFAKRTTHGKEIIEIVSAKHLRTEISGNVKITVTK